MPDLAGGLTGMFEATIMMPRERLEILYIALSWSWASLKGKVSFHNPDMTCKIHFCGLEILGVFVDTESANAFGRLKGSIMTIRAELFQDLFLRG